MAKHHCIDCKLSFDYETPQQFLDIINEKTGSENLPCRICIIGLIRITTTSEKWECFICTKIFKQKLCLINHFVVVHIGSKPFSCKICFKRFKLNNKLTSHMNVHTSQKEKCKYCDAYLRRDHIKYHMNQYHNEDKPTVFMCDKCGKELISLNSLQRHLQVHDGINHKCTICNKVFLIKNDLHHHSSRVHRGIKYSKKKTKKTDIEKCSVCQKEIRYMKIHLLHVHGVGKNPSDKIIRCENCGVVLKSKEILQLHMNSFHEKKKKYICDICGKSFLRDIILSRHKKIHTGVKNYKCASCGLSFNQKCTLTRHQVVHTGEKPFECGICGQRFTQKPYMKVHEKKCKKGKQKTKKKREESSEESEEMSEEISEDEN